MYKGDSKTMYRVTKKLITSGKLFSKMIKGDKRRCWLSRPHHDQYRSKLRTGFHFVSFFLGDCVDYDSRCGTNFPQSMCLSHPELMAKMCPKMCKLCGELIWSATKLCQLKWFICIHDMTRDSESCKYHRSLPAKWTIGWNAVNTVSRNRRRNLWSAQATEKNATYVYRSFH